MPHMCALITIAMQLTCVVDKEIICRRDHAVFYGGGWHRLGRADNLSAIEREGFRGLSGNLSFRTGS
jgi:hypothetical protein